LIYSQTNDFKLHFSRNCERDFQKLSSVDCENLIEIASRVFDWFSSFCTSLIHVCATGDRQT